MSEVIETDFVLGKLDGKRFESAAKLIDRELRQFNNLNYSINQIYRELGGDHSAMLFNTTVSLIYKLLSGLEYELSSLYWETTILADRSTGQFASIVLMLGDCRSGEVPRLSFDVTLDLEGKGVVFQQIKDNINYDRTPFELIDDSITGKLPVTETGWLTRWRPASLNKVIRNLRELAEISNGFAYNYEHDEARDGDVVEPANYLSEVFTSVCPLAVSLRHGAVGFQLSEQELANAQAITTVCLEIPTDCYRVHFLES